MENDEILRRLERLETFMDRLSASMETLARIETRLAAHTEKEDENREGVSRLHERIDGNVATINMVLQTQAEQRGALKFGVYVIPGLFAMIISLLSMYSNQRLINLEEAAKDMQTSKSKIALIQRDIDQMRKIPDAERVQREREH